MKKLLQLFVLMLLPILASAETVEIDGIWYNLVPKVKEAEVTKNPNVDQFSGSYSGNVEIPASFTYNDIKYSVTSIGVEAFYRSSGLTSVTIPNSVTSIGYCAFCSCSILTSITIPNSVTSIGAGAFSYCSALTSITIPYSVTSIGNDAFSGCTGLTSVTIPNSVTSIGRNTFSGCSWLTSITIPNSVTSIGNYAFSRCSSLTSITIPNSVTSIGIGAFWNCSGLTSINIPNGVTSIGSSAFQYCSGLNSVTIGSAVNSIGEQTFANCNELTDVYCLVEKLRGDNWGGEGLYTHPDAFKDSYPQAMTLHVPTASINAYGSTVPWSGFMSVVAIGDDSTISGKCGDNVYYSYDKTTHTLTISGQGEMYGYDPVGGSITPWNSYCNDIQSVIIGTGVTIIGTDAFNSCKNLTSVTIPNSVTTIYSRAFLDCSSLRSVTIPNSVTCITASRGSGAFSGCSGLTSILVESGNNYFDSRNNCNAIIDSNNQLILGCKNTIIPNSVTSIGRNAFDGCSGLTSITIPDGVISIGMYAFQGCSGLTSVTIPNSVTSIGGSAFENCSGLTSITIPNSVTTLANEAFYKCSGLKTVISEIENPFAVNKDVFDGIPSNATLIVPKGKKSAYQSTAGWNQITNIVEAGDDSTISGKCGENVYYSYDKTTHTLTIYGEGGMDSYEKKSTPWWSYKDDIQSVIIGSGVTSIGPHAFEFHRCLTSITIPNSVTGIGLYAFEGSSNGKLINIISEILEPFGVQFAFHENAIVLLTVPKDTKALYKATRGWNALNMHIVEAGVGIMEDDNGICYTLDGESAVVLMGVSTKGDVKIKESVETDGKTYQVTDIDDHAFYNTGEITSVVIPKSVETIGSSAFEDCTGLTSLILNEGLLSVGGSAFEGCTGLKSLTIPSTVNTIKMNAFKNCKAITDVYCYAQTVPNTDDAAFDGTPIESATLHVPIGCLDAYKAVAPWKNFKSILEIEDAKVKLSKTKATIEKGKTLTLKATVTPSDLPVKSVTWKSSNKNVATVTSAGKVKGIKAGTATITCTSKATGAKATCKVTVGYVKLNKTEAVINKGKTLTLKAAVYPSTLKDRSVIWKSSNKNVATVTSKGKVKGVKAGTATITCTSNATGLKATCKVTVGYVKLDQSEVTVKKGKTVTLKAAVYPSTLEDKSVTWESSNKKVATVTSKGKVKGIKAGLAVITCTSNATGLSTTCIVKVKATAGTRSMEGDDNDEVTDIDELETSATIKPFDVYDLGGRKVLHQVTSLDGLPDGIYIVNGKKILKK